MDQSTANITATETAGDIFGTIWDRIQPYLNRPQPPAGYYYDASGRLIPYPTQSLFGISPAMLLVIGLGAFLLLRR